MATRKKPAAETPDETPNPPTRLTFAGTCPDKESAINRAAQLQADTGNPHFFFKRNEQMWEIFADCG